MTQSIRSLAFVAITLFLGACGANPIQFAQCKLDTDADGNALKSSKDCEGGTSCQQFDGGEPGLQGMLCNDAANPCSTTSNAFKTCQDMGKICQVITLTDGSKGAKCVVEDPICANNGGCPSDTVCTPDGKGGKLCNTMTPAGTCSKQSDCATAQFCNIPVGKCEADHTVGQTCSMGTPATRTAEMCTTSRCNADLRCGCNTTADCSGGMVCDTGKFECVTPVACTADGNGSCNWSNEFCASAQICETKHDVGGVCNRPAMCKSGQCNGSQICGCKTNSDCMSGLVCSTTNVCVVDQGVIDEPWVEICFTLPGGGTPVVFHSDAANNSSFTAGPYVLKPTDVTAPAPVSCLILKRVVCGSMSIPQTSATIGEGPLTATNAWPLFPASKIVPGIQFQACNGPDLKDPKCYPGMESGRSLQNEVTKLTFRGVGNNTLPLTVFSLKNAIWLQLMGITSASGNPSAQPAQYNCR